MRRLNALDWFRVGALTLVAATTILGASSVDSSLQDMRRAALAAARLDVFGLAFAASTALNAELRPLELALGSDRLQSQGLMPELRGTRIQTDLALRRFREAAAAEAEMGTMNFAFLTAKLQNERARADKLLALPLSERRVGEQLSVIRGMISASETIEPLVGVSARRVIVADRNLAGPVNVSRLLGTLYEAASRLPSEVLPVLKARDALPPEVRLGSLRLQQRILALWDVGGSQLEFGESSERLASALADIRGLYFGKGFPFLSRAIERYSRVAPVSDMQANQLSQVYGPTVFPIARLRDLYVSGMIADARKNEVEAARRATMTLGLTGLILLIMPILVWTTYRQILRPLLQFRDRILAICEGTPIASRPYLGSVPPLRHLYRALETLQERDRERRALDIERTELAERLRTLSETDELTRLLNRRGLWRILDPFGVRETPIALVLADIDHFKRVNDRHGHVEGDRVLRAFSDRLRLLGGEDVVVARYGGEEFALVLRNRPLDKVLELIETLRADIEAMSLDASDGTPIRVTGSFGVAYAQGPVEDWDHLVRQADAALYAAKTSGRNRVRATNEVLTSLGNADEHRLTRGDGRAAAGGR